MMQPEDEANSDAPLVPDVEQTDRAQFTERTRANSPRHGTERLRRELEAIRSRLDDVESRLIEEVDRR